MPEQDVIPIKVGHLTVEQMADGKFRAVEYTWNRSTAKFDVWDTGRRHDRLIEATLWAVSHTQGGYDQCRMTETALFSDLKQFREDVS